MSPKAKKIKTDHVQSTETVAPVQVEEKEPEWYNLEDLEAEDIDDEYGDMVIEQRLLVNNEVNAVSSVVYININSYSFINRMLWNVLQTTSG